MTSLHWKVLHGWLEIMFHLNKIHLIKLLLESPTFIIDELPLISWIAAITVFIPPTGCILFPGSNLNSWSSSDTSIYIVIINWRICWVEVNGKWYYLDERGAMLANTTTPAKSILDIFQINADICGKSFWNQIK